MDNNSNVGRPSSPSNAPKINRPISNFGSNLKTAGIITGSEHVPQQNVPPKNYKKIIISLAVAILSVLLVTAIILILVLPSAVRPADISLDFTAVTDVLVDKDPATASSYKVMPGDEIQCIFSLEALPNEETQNVNNDVFLRVKTSIICEDNYYSGIITMHFVNQSDWFKGADGFYYYQKTNSSDGLMSVGEKIQVMKGMSVDKEIGNEFAGKTITIKFFAEVLQAQYQAIEEIWPTAPWEWASQYKDLNW